MKLTMLQDCLNSHNELQAAKGEKIELISDFHFPVLLVRGSRGNSFSVKAEGTDYKPKPTIYAGALCGKCQRSANNWTTNLAEDLEKRLLKRFGRLCEDCRKEYLNK